MRGKDQAPARPGTSIWQQEVGLPINCNAPSSVMSPRHWTSPPQPTSPRPPPTCTVQSCTHPRMMHNREGGRQLAQKERDRRCLERRSLERRSRLLLIAGEIKGGRAGINRWTGEVGTYEREEEEEVQRRYRHPTGRRFPRSAEPELMREAAVRAVALCPKRH